MISQIYCHDIVMLSQIICMLVHLLWKREIIVKYMSHMYELLFLIQVQSALLQFKCRKMIIMQIYGN